jgi:acetolactate synthase I/II/III large subunit
MSDGGEALLAACRDLGADYIFSSAGSEWAPVWEGLARQTEAGGAGPRYLDLTHETIAVAMATGYAAETGQVPVVLLHAGAGLLQGANAVHGALLTGVPMVVCSGESAGYGDGAGRDPGSQWYRNLSVVGGPQALAAPFTKWACAANDVGVLYGMVRRAGELAAQPPAGPVYVNTPVEVLLAEWRPAVTGPVPRAAVAVPAAEDVATAARLLATAQRPVLAVESVGRDPAAFAALVELAELLAIPVIEPQSAVCANFPRSHPLHQGGDLAALAADADLVVLAGCRAPWYPPSTKPGSATVLVIDEVPHRPQMAYQVLTADCYVGGAAAPALRAIAARVREDGFDAGPVRARFDRLTGAHAAADQARRDAEERALADPAGAVDPAAVASMLRDLLDPAAVVVDETITHSRTIVRHLLADVPGRYRYVQGGLGQGLGVALGVKLALGSERMVAFTVGDGSWLYNPVLPGLTASAQYGLPVLTVVFNNGSYRSMQLNHLRAYPEGAAVRTGHFLGVDLSAQPDVAAVATAAGAAGFTVTSTGQLGPALDKAMAAVRDGQSAVVNVQLSR